MIHVWHPDIATHMQYLQDPEGKFVTFYGKSFTAAQIADSLCNYISEWDKTT